MECLRLAILVCSLALYTYGMHTYIAGDLEDSNNLLRAPQFREKRQAPASDPAISSYHITSTVTARFVSTAVLVTVENDGDASQEVRFGFKLSPNAFISGFVMTVDGVSYPARVREKQAAQKAYNQARSEGKSAAQVRQKADSSRFFVDLNLAAATTVVFNLTYQELLRRDKGLFTLRINAAPGQVVDDFRVEVIIIEPQGLEMMESSWESSDAELTPSVQFIPSTTSATVLFNPSRVVQSRANPDTGLNGVLEVRYDVIHELNGGDLQVVNGYFVHHISPEGLPPAPKKVIFVIDVSGSMLGRKMEQTKNAISLILDELRDIDSFNLMTFSSRPQLWNRDVVPATDENKIAAKLFVESLVASGGTNIHAPLIVASRQFNIAEESFPAIVFLTDGQPNTGITDTDEIVRTVEASLDDRVALFCIGFGSGVDDVLLTRLASTNQGIYRKVFEDSSASLQMQNFFEEVATPLLFNIAVRYLDGAVDADSLTGKNFISYFDGKELIVAGKIADDYEGNSLVAVVEGKGREDLSLRVSKEIDQIVDPNMVNDFCQRMWAFLTIKDYLAREKLSTSPAEKAELKQKALELSLKYSFVTPLTSLLIIRPDDTVPVTLAPLTTEPLPLPLPPPLPVYNPAAIQALAPSYLQSAPLSQLTRAFSPIQAGRRFRPLPISVSRAGGDPHFIVDLPHKNLTICFDFQADTGTFINLISDPVLGIHVNAEVIEVEKSAPGPSQAISNSKPSLLGSIGILLGHYKVLITPEHALVDFEIKIPWGNRKTLLIGQYNLTVDSDHTMTITVANSIQMVIIMHNQWRNHPVFFDFKMETADGFSNAVHGLIGQFQHKRITLKSSYIGMSLNGHVRGLMEIEGKNEYVFKMTETVITTSECWWARPEKYMDGNATDYFVSGHFSELTKFIQIQM